MTPRRRVLSPVLRGGPASESPFKTPPLVVPSPEQLKSGDTPQGKRLKVTRRPMNAKVCQEAQKALQKWKQQGLQSLNYHAHCVNTHLTAVKNAWSATAAAHFRVKHHEWIRWANKEHGMQLYQFKKQAGR